MSKLGELVKYACDLGVLRRVVFASVHLPQDMPNYWQTIADFAHEGLPAAEVKTMVENLRFLNEAAFATDSNLLSELHSSAPGDGVPTGVVLISKKEKCGLCGGRLILRADRPRPMVLYTLTHGALPATHYRKVCSRSRSGCTFVQHYGYHSEGDTIEYDKDWNTLEHFVVSRETAFDMQLLEKFDVELLIGQVSYKQSSDIYNCWNKYEQPATALADQEEDVEPSISDDGKHLLYDRLRLDRRRLESAHLLFAALKVHSWYTHSLPTLKFKLGELDQVLLELVPSYHSAFSTTYTEHHCSIRGCNSVLVLDGNMKNHRDVCKAKHAGFVEFDGLPGQIRSGCQKTPDFKSRYCSLHKPRACVLSDPRNDGAGTSCTTDKADEGIVQMVLEKKTTRKSTYYKVLLVGESDVETSWCLEKDLPAGIIDEYNKQLQLETRVTSLRYSGQEAVTAVVVPKDATLSDLPPSKKPKVDTFKSATAGPLKKTDDDSKDLSCRTEKDKHIKLNERSAGILAGMWPCGVILFISELFISESLPQVYGVLHEFLRQNQSTSAKLNYICYDDGCHLRKFARNPIRRDLTSTTKKLSTLEIVVDKMHIAGHVDPWCLKTCDARKVKDLEKVDTQVCEQNLILVVVALCQDDQKDETRTLSFLCLVHMRPTQQTSSAPTTFTVTSPALCLPKTCLTVLFLLYCVLFTHNRLVVTDSLYSYMIGKGDYAIVIVSSSE